jgi:phosphoglycolate phosphatase
MAKRFDLLVFDWDGTLIDSAAHIAAALQEAFRDLALGVPSTAAARHVIGLGLEDAMTYLNPSLDRSRYEQVADRYRVHFLARDQGMDLFPVVATVLPP